MVRNMSDSSPPAMLKALRSQRNFIIFHLPLRGRQTKIHQPTAGRWLSLNGACSQKRQGTSDIPKGYRKAKDHFNLCALCVSNERSEWAVRSSFFSIISSSSRAAIRLASLDFNDKRINLFESPSKLAQLRINIL